MKLKDMPSLIKAFTDEKSVPHQYSIIEACLRRILNEMSPGSDRSPHSEQIRTVRRPKCSIEVYVINLRSMTEATKIGLADKSIKLCPKN
jgi:hypothetical protein